MTDRSRAITYAELLGELIELQGEHLVVSYSIDDMAAFTYFDALFERGHSVNHPGLLGHDEESIELEFSNGVLVTIDPTKFKAAVIEQNENGSVLKIRMGDVKITIIRTHR